MNTGTSSYCHRLNIFKTAHKPWNNLVWFQLGLASRVPLNSFLDVAHYNFDLAVYIYITLLLRILCAINECPVFNCKCVSVQLVYVLSIWIVLRLFMRSLGKEVCILLVLLQFKYIYGLHTCTYRYTIFYEVHILYIVTVFTIFISNIMTSIASDLTIMHRASISGRFRWHCQTTTVFPCDRGASQDTVHKHLQRD